MKGPWTESKYKRVAGEGRAKTKRRGRREREREREFFLKKGEKTHFVGGDNL